MNDKIDRKSSGNNAQEEGCIAKKESAQGCSLGRGATRVHMRRRELTLRAARQRALLPPLQ